MLIYFCPELQDDVDLLYRSLYVGQEVWTC